MSTIRRPSRARWSTALVALAVVAASARSANARTGGAPTSTAGDPPGNLTCNQGGCHNTFALNDPAGRMTLGILDSATLMPFTAYVPGRTYTLTFGVGSGALNRNRWGFESTSLSGMTMAGTFPAAINGRYQVLVGAGGKRYVTHTFSGVSPLVPGPLCTWDVSWQAPATDIGTIRFYLCGNAANGTGTSTNDYIQCGTFDVSTAPADTDGDTLADSIETGTCTSPTDADTDDDGLSDGAEITGASFTNPCVCDTDLDGLPDGLEEGVVTALPATDVAAGCFQPDTDPLSKTSPTDADDDDDGLSDGAEDTNANGKVDAMPVPGEADPRSCDTDMDGLPDGLEEGVDTALPDTSVAAGCFEPDTDPLSRTSPTLVDTDGDTCEDAIEDANANGAVDTMPAPGETDPALDGDCPRGPGSMLRLMHWLNPPVPLMEPIFATVPCTTISDIHICNESGGMLEDIPDPVLPANVAGHGLLVCLDYDSDLAALGTDDTIYVVKDPALSTGLIVKLTP